MRIDRSTLKHRWGILTSALIVAGVVFTGGFYLGAEHDGRIGNVEVFAGEREDGTPVDFTPFWEVWTLLDEKFAPAASSTPPTDQEKLWGAIQGMTKAYDDPYTVFLPPSDAKVFEEDISGNFEGVGMEIGIRNDVLTVVAPLAGTPAKQAGLQSGDKILAIDGTTTEGMSVERAVKLIRGEKETDVVLTITRESFEEPKEISVTRDTIEIPTIETQERDGVFIIRIFNFSAAAPDRFRSALREFVETDKDMLIVDVRNNPGGFLQAAVEMASWFVPMGKPVVTEDYGDERDDRVHRSRGYRIFDEDITLAVLANGGSASASEIFAGALQQHGVATLVGTQTFGKGSVQELVETTGDTSLKVTVARWVTPDGTVISGNGLTPDVVAEMPEQPTSTDPQLDRAIEVVQNK